MTTTDRTAACACCGRGYTSGPSTLDIGDNRSVTYSYGCRKAAETGRTTWYRNLLGQDQQSAALRWLDADPVAKAWHDARKLGGRANASSLQRVLEDEVAGSLETMRLFEPVAPPAGPATIPRAPAAPGSVPQGDNKALPVVTCPRCEGAGQGHRIAVPPVTTADRAKWEWFGCADHDGSRCTSTEPVEVCYECKGAGVLPLAQCPAPAPAVCPMCRGKSLVHIGTIDGAYACTMRTGPGAMIGGDCAGCDRGDPLAMCPACQGDNKATTPASTPGSDGTGGAPTSTDARPWPVCDGCAGAGCRRCNGVGRIGPVRRECVVCEGHGTVNVDGRRRSCAVCDGRGEVAVAVDDNGPQPFTDSLFVRRMFEQAQPPSDMPATPPPGSRYFEGSDPGDPRSGERATTIKGYVTPDGRVFITDRTQGDNRTPTPPTAPPRGHDATGGTPTPTDAHNGDNARTARCPACGGKGARLSSSGWLGCPLCDGRGEVPVPAAPPLPSESWPCVTCNGEEEIHNFTTGATEPCPTCQGDNRPVADNRTPAPTPTPVSPAPTTEAAPKVAGPPCGACNGTGRAQGSGGLVCPVCHGGGGRRARPASEPNGGAPGQPTRGAQGMTGEPTREPTGRAPGEPTGSTMDDNGGLSSPRATGSGGALSPSAQGHADGAGALSPNGEQGGCGCAPHPPTRTPRDFEATIKAVTPDITRVVLMDDLDGRLVVAVVLQGSPTSQVSRWRQATIPPAVEAAAGRACRVELVDEWRLDNAAPLTLHERLTRCTLGDNGAVDMFPLPSLESHRVRQPVNDRAVPAAGRCVVYGPGWVWLTLHSCAPLDAGRTLPRWADPCARWGTVLDTDRTVDSVTVLHDDGATIVWPMSWICNPPPGPPGPGLFTRPAHPGGDNAPTFHGDSFRLRRLRAARTGGGTPGA